MNKICTTVEQSKRLIELGIDINTADMHYYKNSFGDYIEGLYNSSDLKEGCQLKGIEYIPAWSLSALFSILPIVYTNNKKEICGPLHVDIIDSETPFVLWYVNPLHKGDIVELQTKEYDNLVDACVEMILKLKENNNLL